MKQLYEMRFWDKKRKQFWEIDYNGRLVYGYNEAKRIAENECEHEFKRDWRKHIEVKIIPFDLKACMSMFWLPFKDDGWEDFILYLRDEKIVNLKDCSLLDYISAKIGNDFIALKKMEEK